MSVEVAKCGALRCQKDSYCRSLTTTVVSCTPSVEDDSGHGLYTVQLADTVLFPEGGGQVRVTLIGQHVLSSLSLCSLMTGAL